MNFEVKIGERTANVKLLSISGNIVEIEIDDFRYNVDLIEVKKGIYSILYKNKSFDIELFETEISKKYIANTFRSAYELEIVDAESKYRKRQKAIDNEGENIISMPMPGKVITVFVKEGDEVKTGQTVIIVEAMKMQNEYEVKKDGKVLQVLVKEGDIINANQPLIIIE